MAKRRKSKVTPPVEIAGTHDTKLTAVRLPADLKRKVLLYANQSEVIIEALEEYFSKHKDCPRCNGTGRISDA